MLGRIMGRIGMLFRNLFMLVKSITWKRSPDTVLIGAWFGNKFADNSRFLYQYLSDNKTELGLEHVVWVSRNDNVVQMLRNMGYEAYSMNSEESIYYHKKAKYHIICNAADSYKHIKADILTEYSWRAVRINLWHGNLAFKGVQAASLEYKMNKKRHPFLYKIKECFQRSAIYRKLFVLPGGWGDCYYLSTTPLVTNIFKQFFLLPDKRFIETGAPRVSYSPRLTPEEEQVIEHLKQYKRTILYLPTFRDEASHFDLNEIAVGLASFFSDNDYLFLQKAHSISNRKLEENIDNKHIMNLSPDFDVNIIIPHISLLISDYSSAVGEAMFFYKPVVFYVPDFEEYRSGDRGFVVDPDSIMCGPKSTDLKNLAKVLKDELENEKAPDQKYCKVRSDYYGKEKTMREIWNTIVEFTE